MLFTEDVPHLFAKFMGKSVPTTNEGWVHIVNQELSPKFWEFAMTFAFTTVEPLIQKVFKKAHLPDIDLKFTKLDLGDISPKIENVEIHDDDKTTQKKDKSVIIDFDLAYFGNCDLQISILNQDWITGGVR